MSNTERARGAMAGKHEKIITVNGIRYVSVCDERGAPATIGYLYLTWLSWADIDTSPDLSDAARERMRGYTAGVVDLCQSLYGTGAIPIGAPTDWREYTPDGKPLAGVDTRSATDELTARADAFARGVQEGLRLARAESGK